MSEGPAFNLQPLFHALHQVGPDQGFPLVVPDLHRLRGPLDLTALERALHVVAQRQEALRTNFVVRDGELRQVVRAPEAPFLPTFSVVERSEAELACEVDDLVRSPLPIEHGHVLAVRIVRLGQQDHALLILPHHTITDITSRGLLWDELVRAYSGRGDDAPRPRPLLECATEQAAYQDSPAGQADRAYWRDRMAGVMPLQFPLDGSREELDAAREAQRQSSALQYVHYRSVDTVMVADEALGPRIQAASEAHGVAPAAIVFAAVAEMLATNTHKRDVSFQSSVDLRARLGAGSTIGGFNCPLLYRVDVESAAWRADPLAAMHTQMLEADAHGRVSPVQDAPEYAGLVNLTVMWSPAPPGERRLGDAIATPLPFTGQMRFAFDLRLVISFDGRRLVIVCNYMPDLFQRGTVEKMAKHLQSALAKYAA